MASSRAGFTLIEVLIALAVFSLGALTLLKVSGESARAAARVEDRTLGAIVAANVGAESLIASAVADGESAGQAVLAGRTWRWVQTISPTDDPLMQRIDVRVSTSEGLVSDRSFFRIRND